MGSIGYTVTPRLQLLLKDLGIQPVDVLRRAGLPDDLFNRSPVVVSTQEWFRMWRALEAETGDPLLPLAIGKAISFEFFDPPVFAAMCSPDLNTALERIRIYKKLCGPLSLRVRRRPEETSVEIHWIEHDVEPPAGIVLMELVFFVQLARLATREPIVPKRVVSPVLLSDHRAYSEFFGTSLHRGDDAVLLFTTADSARRLGAEGESYQTLLNATRANLASHYLKSKDLSGGEISFLLGYANPNSFFRAFHAWTGKTPEQARASMRA